MFSNAPFITHHGVNQRQVADEIFLVSLQLFFPLDVVTGHTLDDERTLQGLQIIINGIDVHPPLLALEVVGDILRIKSAADIVEHEAYHPFQQFHVADTVPLHRVAQDDGRINVIYKLVNGFEAVITRMNSRETAHAKVFLKLFPQYVLAIRIYTMKQKIFIEGQRHDVETDVPACQISGQLRGKQPGAGYGDGSASGYGMGIQRYGRRV